MKNTLRDDNILTLKSGKKLGYAEYGNPEGIPILVHHGNPGSRLFWGMLPESPFDESYRLIAPDRPGYGFSEHYGRESILKWPGIVEELMDHLHIDNFYNVGVSGGGPYALICAASLNERIFASSLIGPVGPFVKESIGDMNINRHLFSLARKLPWLIILQFRLTTKMIKRNPASFINLIKKKLKGEDRILVEEKNIQKLLTIDFLEAYRFGADGSIYDCFIPTEWPIQLEKIKGSVEVWNGTQDRSIGDMAKYIGEQIPSAVTHTIPDMGHLFIIHNMKKVLDSMVKE